MNLIQLRFLGLLINCSIAFLSPVKSPNNPRNRPVRRSLLSVVRLGVLLDSPSLRITTSITKVYKTANVLIVARMINYWLKIATIL